MTQNTVTLAKADLDAWLAGYERAWERKDANAAAALACRDHAHEGLVVAELLESVAHDEECAVLGFAQRQPALLSRSKKR